LIVDAALEAPLFHLLSVRSTDGRVAVPTRADSSTLLRGGGDVVVSDEQQIPHFVRNDKA
jgi:hypothetical protein